MKKDITAGSVYTFEQLFSAAYGKGEPTAQIMALFFMRYFGIVALARKLRERGKLIPKIDKIYDRFGHLLSVSLGAITDQIQDAVNTGNAQFLKNLALALEEQHRNTRGRDPVRTWLLMHKLKMEAPLTAKQIQALLNTETKVEISERQVYRVCKELGINLAKGREGRPRKTATSRRRIGRSC